MACSISVISKKQTYQCNRNGNCVDCVAFHRVFGGLPLCFDFEEIKKYEEQKRLEEEAKLEAQRIEQEKRAEEIRLEQERLEEQKRRAEEIKLEKERIQQEKILEIILEEKENLEKKGLLLDDEPEVEHELEETIDAECDDTPELPPQDNKASRIEVFFRCCSVYGKLYLSIDRAHYVGKCPKCMAKLTAPASSDAPRFGLRQ